MNLLLFSEASCVTIQCPPLFFGGGIRLQTAWSLHAVPDLWGCPPRKKNENAGWTRFKCWMNDGTLAAELSETWSPRIYGQRRPHELLSLFLLCHPEIRNQKKHSEPTPSYLISSLLLHLSIPSSHHRSRFRVAIAKNRQNVLQPPQLRPSPLRRSPLLCLSRKRSGLSPYPINRQLPKG
ncbi:hypothetical protein VTI74DRAFT_10111 [Chaetomium olivicolor]